MDKLTPMMAQYRRIKEQYRDCILMFRMGDFYEMFFEDAHEASKILQIALTARNKGSETKTPMCGVPYHALDQYLYKLTRIGKKVAICDQMTEPDGKSLVERKVVRVVTPGTTFDEHILEQKSNNYIACVVENGERYGLAFCDVTTGEFKVTEFGSLKELQTELGRLAPAEAVCNDDLMKKIRTLTPYTHIFPYAFFAEAEMSLRDHFKIISLKGFGLDAKPLSILTAATLLSYLKETQKTDLNHIQKITYYEFAEFMPLDQSCIRNLELFYTNRDNARVGSLIWVLDQTVSPMGGRMLKKWLLHPLLKRSEIEARLDNVEKFVKNSGLLREARTALEKIYDIERLLSRLSLGSGNARDLVTLKQSLMMIPKLKEFVAEDFVELARDLDPLEKLTGLIERVILEEPSALTREGGMIKRGYNPELDELVAISTEGKTFIKDLQAREIRRTGINSLKIKFNKVFGYYIEISKTNLSAVPNDYIRKQTLVNAERFITPELKEYEEKVLSAEDRIKELEYELFYQVVIEVLKEIVKIQKNAEIIAMLDVLSGLAFLAVKNRYCKPVISNDALKIIDGRHPVVEQMIADFVPNDCVFDETRRFFLVTGPNMGGKSTYLRQVALIVLMAQIGSYIPAESAKIALVDRIFTRVGAADNLSGGESTFMVEMNEAAYILNNATRRSLIILDEVGRGTSTYDGVSIAWAISEFIHDRTEARTLFATHYHELIELADRLSCGCNLSVAVRENEREGVVFLYKIMEGGVDKSYGIEVAKLAGLPPDVVSRARVVLAELEIGHASGRMVSSRQSERQHGGILSE